MKNGLQIDLEKSCLKFFFKHYTEKLWGIKCFQIDADWAAQRIKSLTLFQAIKSALSFSKENKHTTLLDKFMYPKNGTGTLYEKTAEHISLKNKIHLNTPIKKVLLDHTNKKVIGIELVNGEVKDASTVISTMPLTLLVKGLPNVPEKVLNATKELYFRNTILVYLEIDQHNLFEDNWLYIHSPDVKHGRITNFRNWCPSLNKDKKTSILCLEFWCFESDQLWNDSDDFITQIAKKEIFNIDLIPSESKILNAKVIKIPKCYPVYEKGYQEKMNVIISYLKTIKGLIPIGRYGAFKYNNQDHSILMGLLATEKITTNQEIDLWKINTDTEYQENAKDILIQ